MQQMHVLEKSLNLLIMKKFWIFGLAVLLLASCATSKKTSLKYDDDAYFSFADAEREANRFKKNKEKAKEEQPVSSNSETSNSSGTTKDENGNLVLRNDYYDSDEFNYDDYYDYSYAARLRRFHGNYTWNYYDPYYTNTYWYNGSPNSYGTSIYTTYIYNYYPTNSYYNWGWNNSWNWGYSWGNSWYNPWNNHCGWTFYNSGWYNPYYGNYGGWYNPYGGFGYNPYGGFAYNQGYWNGFYNGSIWGNGPYYNSFDYNTQDTYYGPKGVNTANGNSLNTSFASVMSEHGMMQEIANRNPIIIPEITAGNPGGIDPGETVDVKPNDAGNIQTGRVNEPGLTSGSDKISTNNSNGALGNSGTGDISNGAVNSGTVGTGRNDSQPNLSNGTQNGNTVSGNTKTNSGNTTNGGTTNSGAVNTSPSIVITGGKTYDSNPGQTWNWGEYNSGGNGSMQKSGTFGEGSRSDEWPTFQGGNTGGSTIYNNGGGRSDFNNGGGGNSGGSIFTPAPSGGNRGGGGGSSPSNGTTIQPRR